MNEETNTPEPNTPDLDALKSQVADAESRAASWEQRYKTEAMERDLERSATVAGCFSPIQILALLGPQSQFLEQIDETGQPTGKYRTVIEMNGKQLTPKQALAELRASGQTRNLFKDFVNINQQEQTEKGINAARLAKEHPSQFRKLLVENPESLGLGLHQTPAVGSSHLHMQRCRSTQVALTGVKAIAMG